MADTQRFAQHNQLYTKTKRCVLAQRFGYQKITWVLFNKLKISSWVVSIFTKFLFNS